MSAKYPTQWYRYDEVVNKALLYLTAEEDCRKLKAFVVRSFPGSPNLEMCKEDLDNLTPAAHLSAIEWATYVLNRIAVKREEGD